MMLPLLTSTFRACIASIFRTYYSFRIVQEPDITFNIIVMGIGAIVEPTIGVVVCCLPVLPRFFQHLGPKFLRTFSWHSASGPGTRTSHWRRLTGSASRLKPLLGRTSVLEKHDSWSRSTASAFRNDSNAFEKEVGRKYVTIDIDDPVPLRRGTSDKTLPPTPTPSTIHYGAGLIREEIEATTRTHSLSYDVSA